MNIDSCGPKTLLEVQRNTSSRPRPGYEGWSWAFAVMVESGDEFRESAVVGGYQWVDSE